MQKKKVMKTKILVLTAVTAFVAVAETPVRVACIGDSITWGYAMTNRVAECYPMVLQELLGDGYEVRNFGDPGAGVYEHCRREGRPKAWRLRDEYAKVLAFKPDIIISNLGINDAVEFMGEFGPEGILRGTFRDQYVSLLRSFETEGRRPRFILWTRLGPTGKGHRLKGKPNASLMETDLAEVAERVGAETLDMLTPLTPFAETPDFAKDGIHPEGGAQRVIAERTLARIDLNAAIARKSREGGGRVIVPGGRHFSRGPIRLKSNVELHFSDGAVVEFSDDPADYQPGVPVSWEGNECYNLSPLVYAYGETNVAVTGRGLLKPRMDAWLAWFADGKRSPGMDAAIDRLKNDWAQHDAPIEERQVWKLPGARFRPQMMMLNRCRNVRLEDFAIRGTPFWTVHLFLCADVVVRGLDIDAYDDRGRWIGNSDGIDIECSRNVLVENCTFRQRDDAIVIKSGKDRDGRRLATPTENVTVRGCTVRGGPTFCAIGSELSGGVRNIRLANCRVTDTIGQFLHVKTNPRRGGFVDGVTVEDVEVKDVHHDFMRVNTRYFYGCPGEEKLEHELLTPIRNLTVRNVHAASAKRLLMLDGDENIPVEGVTLENVRADKVAEPDVVRSVKGFQKKEK